jgi:hypothetical protein
VPTLRSVSARRIAANEFAPAFSHTVFDSDWNTADFDRWMGGNDLVDAMWFATWIMLGAIHFIAEPGNGNAANGMQ